MNIYRAFYTQEGFNAGKINRSHAGMRHLQSILKTRSVNHFQPRINIAQVQLEKKFKFNLKHKSLPSNVLFFLN